MNNRCKRWTRLISMLLCMALLMGCSVSDNSKTTGSGAVMEKEQSNAISASFLGGKDVMPITGYFGPYELTASSDGNIFPDYITDEYYQMIADAGINLMVYSMTDYKSSPEAVKKNLQLGEKYGVGSFVTDSNVTGKIEQDEINAEEVAKELVNYSDYEAFCGMYLVDEPQATYYQMGDGSRLISKYGQLADVLHNELDITSYCNLYPIMDIAKNRDNYEKYVEEFCDTLQPKMLCWDFYPFDKKREGKMEVYFYNMDLIRKTAAEREIPFWSYIQAGSQWNDDLNYFDSEKPYYPNEFQFNWNVNTSLAFGAQGIQYFPLVQPQHFAYADQDGWDFERNGILGAVGNKTQWYYYAQNINKHIAAIDEVLMNSVNKGVIVNGKQANEDMQFVTCVIESGTFQQLKKVSGDAMVGCFNYNGKTALYVVNYSMEKAQKITLDFTGTQNVRMIQNAETSYVKGSALTLDMAAGEGALLVLE